MAEIWISQPDPFSPVEAYHTKPLSALLPKDFVTLLLIALLLHSSSTPFLRTLSTHLNFFAGLFATAAPYRHRLLANFGCGRLFVTPSLVSVHEQPAEESFILTLGIVNKQRVSIASVISSTPRSRACGSHQAYRAGQFIDRYLPPQSCTQKAGLQANCR